MRQLYICDVMHRDIKPANILLDKKCPKPVFKLADFGLAKRLNNKEAKVVGIDGDMEDQCLEEGTKVGTPVYMAPEINMHGRAYGLNCDVWSIGVMILEAIVGTKNIVSKAKKSPHK